MRRSGPMPQLQKGHEYGILAIAWMFTGACALFAIGIAVAVAQSLADWRSAPSEVWVLLGILGGWGAVRLLLRAFRRWPERFPPSFVARAYSASLSAPRTRIGRACGGVAAVTGVLGMVFARSPISLRLFAVACLAALVGMGFNYGAAFLRAGRSRVQP